MASWAPAAQEEPLTAIKVKDDHASAGQPIALVEGCDGCSEQELRARLNPFGPIAWCNSVDNGRYLVRFVTIDSLSAAQQALDGSVWNGRAIRIAKYCVGSGLVPGLQQVDSPFGRSESIPAMLPDQLDFLDMLIAEERSNNQQQAQQQGLLGQQSDTLPGFFPELEPCHQEWNPKGANELLAPLEDEVLSLDESPMHSFTSGSSPSTAQLWAQRSIGAVARKDLAKFAALQSMVHQHSNSSSPGPGIMSHSSLNLACSPWGSFTGGSSSTEAAPAGGGLAGTARRVSSPAGHSATLTPRSNSSFAANPDAASMQNQQLPSGHSGSSSNAWPTHLLQLPSDLGLGDTYNEDPVGSMLHLAAQQQGGQQVLRNGMNADSMAALLEDGILGTGYGAGDPIGKLKAADSCRDLLGSMPGGAMPAPPPPPPPAQQQLHHATAPPPPPPRNGDGCMVGYVASNGRLSGAASPVPAPPPPRAVTPGGTAGPGQLWALSPGSPCFAGGSQPQSPSRPPRAATRLFQPGMSNLGHHHQGLHPQHSYDGNHLGPQQQPALPTGAFNQPPSQNQQQYRVNSPVSRVPRIVPPPPPPGMPGYVAASAAAAANGICGSPVPPASPGGVCGPLPGMLSCPNGMIEAMVRGAGAALPSHAKGAYTNAVHERTVNCSAGQAPASADAPVYKADGAMFVQELLQLLRSGAAAGSAFLTSLMDLLDCALASTAATPATPATAKGSCSEEAAASSNKDSAACSSSQADCMTIGAAASTAAPVDAAAFLGMLQEAAAPLVAAAVAGAARTSMMGQQPSKRCAQRTSEIANSSSGMAAGSKQAGDALNELGKGLRPIKTDRSSAGGVEQACSDVDTPPGMLLRHQLSGRAGGSAPGSPMFYPLHPRTTTHGGGPSSCGGAAPGTPHGTPMLLVPQTLPELLSARAALIRLMTSAHSFVQSPAYAYMAAKLDGVEGIYDSMHDDPVVVKRRKCKEMAAMRDIIKVDQAFTQAVASLSSLRNHIYSLSRKVLIGYGHVEGLPVDLLLGGLTSELAAILNDPSGQLPPGVADSQANSSTGGVEQQGETTAGDTGSGGSTSAAQGLLPQPVMEFFSCALPVPKLALLVFTEFVPVDPSPCCMMPAPAAPAPGAASGGGNSSAGGSDLKTGGSGAGSGGTGALAGNSVGGHGGYAPQRGSNLSRHSRRSSNSSAEGMAGGSEVVREAGGPANQRERRNSNSRHSREGERGDRAEINANSNGNTLLYRSRGGSFNSRSDNGSNSSTSGGGGNSAASGGGVPDSSSGSGRQQPQRGNSRRRESQQCDFDLIAEAAALEAAASAAAPLVAAAVCDLPTGARKRGSNSGV